jgi:hypothetical protein
MVLFIMIGTFAEYIILGMNVLFMVYHIYLEKKVLKTDPKASEKLIKSKEFFIYIESDLMARDRKLKAESDEKQELIDRLEKYKKDSKEQNDFEISESEYDD